MKLTATRLGRRLSQHPFHTVEVVNDALCFSRGMPTDERRHELRNESHRDAQSRREQLIVPFRQLLAIEIRRGIVWGELQVVLDEGETITLHGTDWNATRAFCAELESRWQQWTQEMLPLVLQALAQAGGPLISRLKALRWLAHDELQQLQQTILQAWQALPIAPQRVACLEACAEPFSFCQRWLDEGEELTRRYNQQFIQRLRQQEFDLFGGCLPPVAQPTESQLEALLLNEPRVLVQGIAGSGKTHIASARAAWLMQQEGVQASQILLLAGAPASRERMLQVLRATLGQDAALPAIWLMHELGAHIVAQADSRKLSELNALETDHAARCAFWIAQWQNQCSEKAAQAKGWAQWLGEELGWPLAEEAFWQDPALCARLSVRLDRWLMLLRRQSGSQKSWLESQVDEEMQPALQKKLRLLNPLLKAWRTHLKEARTQDSLTLERQAQDLLAAGRYVSLFTHIICDDAQLLSLRQLDLLQPLVAHRQTRFYALGDDWQRITRYVGDSTSLSRDVAARFGMPYRITLDTDFRQPAAAVVVNQRLAQQHPDYRDIEWHGAKSDTPNNASKHPVRILPEGELEPLLDLLSGVLQPTQSVVISGRSAIQRPACVDYAARRWPRLSLRYIPLTELIGVECEHLILTGLQGDKEGFPAPVRETVVEQALLPPAEYFPDAEERRLLYLALTRARAKTWLLAADSTDYSAEHHVEPSRFLARLREAGVPLYRRAQ